MLAGGPGAIGACVETLALLVSHERVALVGDGREDSLGRGGPAGELGEAGGVKGVAGGGGGDVVAARVRVVDSGALLLGENFEFAVGGEAGLTGGVGGGLGGVGGGASCGQGGDGAAAVLLIEVQSFKLLPGTPGKL